MKLFKQALSILLISSLVVQLEAASSPFPDQPEDKSRGLLDLFRFITSSFQNEKVSKDDENAPKEVFNWPSQKLDVGQISGVAVDLEDNPVIFHRGPHSWDASTFDSNNRYRYADKGPIQENAIITLNQQTGQVVSSYGNGLFYMPHGLHIDQQGNTWVTDVALHQVFKFPRGSTEASLVLGVAFTPGTDLNHFCKPADVAASTSGIFFVADGYCNNRILKFSANGTLLEIFRSDFNVPHSLTLIEEKDVLCVANREGQKVNCIRAGLDGKTRFGTEVADTPDRTLGRVFAITGQGSKIYGVTGPTFLKKTEGFTFDLDQPDVVSRWNPQSGFHNPHDIAVSRDGTSLYAVEIGPNRVMKMAL